MIKISRNSMTHVYRTSILFAVFSLVFTLSAPLAHAQQDPSADLDPDPLKPPDTSSPRDTLRGFLTNASKFVADWDPGTPLNPAAYKAFRHTLEALDFSATP